MSNEPEVIPSEGERMTYLVRSETNPNVRYRVDLLHGGGAGCCSCTDHQTRRQPFLDEGGDPFVRQGFCKHTFKARRYFLRKLLKHMAEEEQR